MRVRERVVRAGCDEESLGVESPVLEWLTGVVPVKSEAAFEAAANLGEVCEPPTVRGQTITIRQSVPDPKSLEGQICERSRRLSDCEARMSPALEQHHIVAKDGEHTCQQ
jgi:hypothetical protein